ncbi:MULTISPECIES: hypothetical protein [Streptomycetaceae]|uniref:Secreted protein n=1 Tax=Streptantibioticus cattleyicolor (strain ATCC 35852 / DSM 46488 / JCM 4925 / NBRC 14057 / NRRL 8057) TaxID=1003195 RepID=G8WPS2_STREN|nr:hypothetical protein [Streptantibioticus cattleyicolor]AEW92861.1 hypothetical protein SCATT_04900 [Streptantibioticus cattleyicolor NRRL 8057 = DSM 46488]
MPTLASADPAPSPSPSASAAPGSDVPPSAVEDFSYPNAAKIQQVKGIKLIKGDGHIMLADCDASAQQIKVLTVKSSTANQQGAYCFKATAKNGYLTLELPRVFALETDDHPISARLTPQGNQQAPATTVSVDKNGYQSVGEGVAGGAPAVLVEIRVTG